MSRIALPPALDAATLKQVLATSTPADLGEVQVHAELDSTNAASLRLLVEQGYSQRLICAHRQTAGRGRRGRVWHSPRQSGIYLSLTRILPSIHGLHALSLVTALSVITALEAFELNSVRVKWPNDVLIDGAKLAGVLLELKQRDDEVAMVFGIGVNLCFSDTERASIARPITDLASHLAVLPRQEELVAGICQKLLGAVEVFLKEGFKPFVELWNQRDAFIDCSVQVKAGSRQRLGIHRGVDAQGALLLEGAQGKEAIHGGEIFPSVQLAGAAAGAVRP